MGWERGVTGSFAARMGETHLRTVGLTPRLRRTPGVTVMQTSDFWKLQNLSKGWLRRRIHGPAASIGGGPCRLERPR
jgi:hypothetical protein